MFKIPFLTTIYNDYSMKLQDLRISGISEEILNRKCMKLLTIIKQLVLTVNTDMHYYDAINFSHVLFLQTYLYMYRNDFILLFCVNTW